MGVMMKLMRKVFPISECTMTEQTLPKESSKTSPTKSQKATVPYVVTEGVPARIHARIASFDEGLEVFDEVRMVRVKSNDHTLLIMEDYLPVLGEVRGSVSLIRDDDERVYQVAHGFYLHSHNNFSLIVDRVGQEAILAAQEEKSAEVPRKEKVDAVSDEQEATEKEEA